MAKTKPDTSKQAQKEDRKPSALKPKQKTAQIAKAARNKKKREKRKAKVQQLKAAARLEAHQAWTRGLPPPKPCHLCRASNHWSQDCEKYGAWKAKMDKKI